MDDEFKSWPPLCFECKLKVADVDNATFYCVGCKATKDAEQAARLETLAKLPAMTWELWVRWLSYYRYDANKDLEWARMAFEKWGHSMRYEGVLMDYPEFEHEFNHRTSQDLDEDHPSAMKGVFEGNEDLIAEDEKLGLRRLIGVDRLV